MIDVSSIVDFPWSTIPLVDVISIPLSLAFGSTTVGYVLTCIFAISTIFTLTTIVNWIHKGLIFLIKKRQYKLSTGQ